jgi:hypothetical protein
VTPTLPIPNQTVPIYAPEHLPPFSSTPYGPTAPGASSAYAGENFRGQDRGSFRGGRDYQNRRHRRREDRPKSKQAIPGCEPWLLVKTKLGRRFVYNPETNESYWKFPADVLKGVVELDRQERDKKARKERGEDEDEAESEHIQPDGRNQTVPGGTISEGTDSRAVADGQDAQDDSDEYEEVEVTDSEGEGEQGSKRPRTESESAGGNGPLEFDEDDIEYQLAAMGEEYGLDPGEYGEPGEDGWEEGAEGLSLTDEEATALFRDLLDDFQINPFTTWEKIVEEGRIIDDSRYTVLSNMKLRREVFSTWSRDRIQEVKERKQKEEKKDPRIKYLSFLQEHATPKLYWPEFKRKYRKEEEMRHTQLSDKDREKYYRDHISRLKLPESTRKSDLSTLLKSIPLRQLNRSSNVEALPPTILTDIRYISLPPKTRDPLVETFISTLPPAPEEDVAGLSIEEQEERERQKSERGKREKALAERERRVQEDKRRQRGDLVRSRNLLLQEEAEIEQAMRVGGKEGLKSYMEIEDKAEAKGDVANE